MLHATKKKFADVWSVRLGSHDWFRQHAFADKKVIFEESKWHTFNVLARKPVVEGVFLFRLADFHLCEGFDTCYFIGFLKELRF